MLTTIVEREPGTGNEVLDGPGDEHLARCRERRDPRPRDDRDTSDLLTDKFALARVDTRTDFKAELGRALHNPFRTRNRSRGTLEAAEEPVTGTVDLDPPMSTEFAAHTRVVTIEDISPARDLRAALRIRLSARRQ